MALSSLFAAARRLPGHAWSHNPAPLTHLLRAEISLRSYSVEKPTARPPSLQSTLWLLGHPDTLLIPEIERWADKPGNRLRSVELERIVKELRKRRRHCQALEVGSKNVVAGESLIRKHMLERFFIDLVAGESLIKERAVARFNDLVGSLDVAAGEPLHPQRFRQNQAWIELKKIWRTKKKVKGFIMKKIKGGYSLGIAGFVTFLPFNGTLPYQ